MKHILNMTPQEFGAEMQAMGQAAYRAGQVGDWVWGKGVCDFRQMTNLPPKLRGELADAFSVLSGKILRRSEAQDGTVKLLIEWPDGHCVECVVIPDGQRRTACLSTQVGCAMGCSFCASGLDGLSRNLTAGEMVEQVFHLRSVCDQRISNVVFMGMGEPLANYEATVSAVRAIIDPERLGISGRRVTVSTIGSPTLIRRFAGEDLAVTLAISLHAPNDRMRRELISGVGKTTIKELLDAGREYFGRRGRELTLEYVLLAGVNDSVECATELAKLAKQVRCNVNLIRFNPVEGLRFGRPSEKAVGAFRDRLSEAGVNVHVRASRGAKANAACGQLRRG